MGIPCVLEQYILTWCTHALHHILLHSAENMWRIQFGCNKHITVTKRVKSSWLMQDMMAALIALLLFFAELIFTVADIYYVTTGLEQSCPPGKLCQTLSYYISQSDYSYFTSDTTIIFLEGQHSFEREDLLYVSNVYNLTLKGQGQWPVAGPEETVMQSTVIINCTKGRGGFFFTDSYSITVEGLTVVNCGGSDVFSFNAVQSLLFHKNSIQRMTGWGLSVLNCGNVIITNCSYYLSVVCDTTNPLQSGGVSVGYSNGINASYTLKLTHSNLTKCCNAKDGGGVKLHVLLAYCDVSMLLSHLLLSHNVARIGANLAVGAYGNCNVKLVISKCLITHGDGWNFTGGMYLDGFATFTNITILNTDILENNNTDFALRCSPQKAMSVYLVNSTIVHTEEQTFIGVWIHNCRSVSIINTRMRLAKINHAGLLILSTIVVLENCLFEGSYNVSNSVVVLGHTKASIRNCVFSNNTGGHSIIAMYNCFNSIICNSTISDNNMTGITVVHSIVGFSGQNMIKNNRYKEGAGITLTLNSAIDIAGELFLNNNTADGHGGAILVLPAPQLLYPWVRDPMPITCTIHFVDNSSSVIFSGNKAGKGGSDIYGAKLMNCHSDKKLPETLSNFKMDTSFKNQLYFFGTDKVSSVSSDPIMVCFCNKSNLPDCSDRTHHIQTYPGLEINTTIATVGYYGGTSPGVVLVSAQHATLARYYGQNETTTCFHLHILLQNITSTTALVDIRVDGGLQGWGLSIGVDILECPIGLQQISGLCRCEQFLHTNNVRCNVSATPFKFVRSGNHWFAYINNTRCITGTTNCPFDYCNRSNVSFDILASDRQCVGNRTGILCGQCQSHLSIMLGSNRCSTCSDWYLFLLPVFALAGIVLVAMLMFLNLSVSVGTINGLLFYANMVKLNEAFFFPNGSVPVVSQFISWLNLDLGIEVCLFDGLDGYLNTWLQFAFPAYLFILMGGIIVGCRYSVWLCRLCGSHAVPALATLFLMSYTKILLTLSSALSMSQLPCNDSILTVWSVDGNIEYGSGKHLILVIFSCCVLVVGLFYPALVLCVPLLERYSHKCIPHKWNPVPKLKPLLDAYGGPYKDKYRFWTGVTLVMRLALAVIFSFTSSSGRLGDINASIIIAIVVGILTVWSFTNGVYKRIQLSALEAIYLLNILFLSLAAVTFKPNEMATIVSVSLALFSCLVTMAMHFYSWCNFDLKRIKRRLGYKPEYVQVPQMAADEDDEEDRPPVSPPSHVYGTHRGVNQFVLEFSDDELETSASTPILLEREPLLFDSTT